jgi:hypothetical protein
MKIFEIAKAIWKDINSMVALKTIAILVGTTIVSVLVTYLFFGLLFPEFTTGLAVRLSRVAMFLGLTWAWDKFSLHEVDTIEELRKGNVAYAIFISAFTLGLAVVCASI